MTEDNAKLTVYTTISPYWDDNCCIEEFPKPKTSDLELKFELDLSPEIIRGRIYYYPEIYLREMEESYSEILPRTTLEWYEEPLKGTNIPMIIAWLYGKGYVTAEIEDALLQYRWAYNKVAKDVEYYEKCEKIHVNRLVDTYRALLPYLDMELREVELMNLAKSIGKL